MNARIRKMKSIIRDDRVKVKFQIDPQIFFLFVCYVLLHLVYVQAVIPPQTGWWHYYAWRINSGEILYKDIFCFLPSYYVYFYSFLFKLFGTSIILYYILGLFIRWCAVCVVYSVICSFTSKNISFLCTFVGLALQVCYLMDVPLDYNQMIQFYIIMSSFFCIKALSEKREKLSNIYLFISGAWLGIGLFTKQTVSVIIFFAVLGITIFYLQYNKTAYVIKKMLIFIFGIIFACLPGIIALFVQGSFDAFINCMTASMTVKGDFGGILRRIVNYQFHFLEVMIAVLIFLMLIFQRRNNRYPKTIFKTSTRVLIKEVYIFSLFLLIVYRACQIIQAETGDIVSYKTVLNAVMIYVAVRIILVCLQNAMSKVGKTNILEFCKSIVPIVLGIVLLCGIIMTYCMSYQWKFAIYTHMSLRNLERGLVNVIFWTELMVLIYQMIQFVLRQEIYGGFDVFLLNAFMMCLVSLGMVSAVVEEYQIFPIAALFFAMIFTSLFGCEGKDTGKTIENILYKVVVGLPVTCLLVVCIFITVTEKQIIPYTWHRWDSVGLGRNDVNYVYSELDGLEGYKLDIDTEIAYETIVELINENTCEDDVVYQFPNIPLFNVLTKRRIGTHTPIHYFDVCPDEIALADARYLEKNPPKMVIWCEFGDWLWDLHEEYFRSGNPSGQRAIRDFYVNDVQKSYQKLYEYKSLSLWLRNE